MVPWPLRSPFTILPIYTLPLSYCWRTMPFFTPRLPWLSISNWAPSPWLYFMAQNSGVVALSGVCQSPFTGILFFRHKLIRSPSPYLAAVCITDQPSGAVALISAPKMRHCLILRMSPTAPFFSSLWSMVSASFFVRFTK